MIRERMTRRQFLAKAAAAGAGFAVLGFGVQCGATPTPEATEVVATETPAVKETVPPEVTEVPLTAVGEKKLLRIIFAPWCDLDQQVYAQHHWILGFAEREVSAFNDTHPDIELKCDSMIACWGEEGWIPTVMSQIQEKKLEWCGTVVVYPFIHMVSRAKSGMHVPMEDHIAASREPGADTMLEDMLPFVLEDIKYEDHIYGIPYGFLAVTFTCRKDLYEAAGWEELPETWDELYAACQDFRKLDEAEGILPYAWTSSLHSSLQSYIYSAMETPYTEEGLLDFMGAGVECLRFMRSLVEAGFTPPHSVDALRVSEMLWDGELGAGLAEHSAALPFWATPDVPLPRVREPQSRVQGGGAGTFFYTSCGSLFQNAPYPQELVDFLIWTWGPANAAMQRKVMSTMRIAPVYQSVYDEIIAKDPVYSDYMWLNDVIDMAAASIKTPKNGYWLAQAAAYEKWAPQFFEKGSELTAEETAKNIFDEVKAEIAKMA